MHAETQPGSSPRGRGTRVQLHTLRIRQRFIPAWAGNAIYRGKPAPMVPVHPRVGGERVFQRRVHDLDFGSSPRGRGTRAHCRSEPIPGRFIPAWAGNARFHEARRIAPPVHPRVGGERGMEVGLFPMQAGSSPRGRGTPDDRIRADRRNRFIPAWAGNASGCRRNCVPAAVHPRVGGERERGVRKPSATAGSSPRGRGTPRRRSGAGLRRRFIPAWAGNAWLTACGPTTPAVHPRVGGERCPPQAPHDPPAGSSPRGRGTRRATC